MKLFYALPTVIGCSRMSFTVAANNTPLKLDVWYPRDNPNPTPTLVYIHGGGWIFGSKEGAVYQLVAVSGKRLARRQCRISNGGQFARSGGGRRYALRSALDLSKCQTIEFRHFEDRSDRTFGRRTSFVDHRNAAGRNAISIIAVTAIEDVEGRGDHELVWHYRCQRSHSRRKFEKLRRNVDGKPAKRAGNRKKRFAFNLCSRRSAADFDDSRRQRRCCSLFARDAACTRHSKKPKLQTNL